MTPRGALATVLGARAGEAEMVRAAVQFLVRAGFLENVDGRSIRIPSLPAAQVPKTTLRLDLDAVTQGAAKDVHRARPSTPRVRARRDTERTGNREPASSTSRERFLGSAGGTRTENGSACRH